MSFNLVLEKSVSELKITTLSVSVLNSAKIDGMFDVEMVIRNFCFGDGSVEGPAVFVLDES